MKKASKTDEFCRAIARVVKDRREQLGLSMTQVGIRAGLSQQSISYLEREMRIPNVDTLLRVSEALQWNLSELIKKAERRAG